MINHANERIGVRWWHNPHPSFHGRHVYPVGVYWRGRWHAILFWGLYHQRDAFRHVYEVASDRYWFRIELDPVTLVPHLETVKGG